MVKVTLHIVSPAVKNYGTLCGAKLRECQMNYVKLGEARDYLADYPYNNHPQYRQCVACMSIYLPPEKDHAQAYAVP